jgi:outer membrane protein TolC
MQGHSRRTVLIVLIGSALLGGQSAGAQQQTTPDSLRLTLSEAVDMALGQGNAAQAAEAARDASLYQHDAFYSRLLPQLSFTGTVPAFNRSIIEVLQPDGSTLFRPQNQTSVQVGATVTQTLPFTGGDLFVSSGLRRVAVSGTQDVLTYSSTPVSVGLRQPIFRPNTVGWDMRAQPIRTETSARAYREARENIAFETARMFFDVYAAQVEFATATTNAAVNDTLYTLNNGRYEIGRIGENDLLQSELALLQAQTAVEAAELQLLQAQAALRLQLNVPDDTPIALTVSDRVPNFSVDTSVAIRQALRNRAAMSNVDLQNILAERQIAEARLNNGFGATLQASYGFNATAADLNGVYNDLLDRQQLTLSVELPLVQWGARSAEINAAQAALDAANYQAQTTHDQTAHDARFAALQQSLARRSLGLSAKGDTVAQKRFEVAYNRYVIGRITIDNLYLAQREKDQARQQYVRALRGFWEAYYQLRRVTLYDFEQNRPID